MKIHSALKEFFFPKLNKKFLIRIVFIASVSYIFFYFVFTPVIIKGRSMEPTIKDGSIHFVCRACYLFTAPKKGDIVGIKLAGRKVVLLKRVVALEGEKVEFRSGKLFINEIESFEPYIKSGSDWNYEGKVVERGKVFVVGDNRGVPVESHDFGEVSKKRIIGKLIW